MSTPRILIMAGGTGGHVYPGLAVAAELRTRGCEVQWLGTAAGLEARLVPGAESRESSAFTMPPITSPFAGRYFLGTTRGA